VVTQTSNSLHPRFLFLSGPGVKRNDTCQFNLPGQLSFDPLL